MSYIGQLRKKDYALDKIADMIPLDGHHDPPRSEGGTDKDIVPVNRGLHRLTPHGRRNKR